MQLDGNDVCAVSQQLRRDRAVSGADIEDKIARLNAGIRDETGSPLVSEPIPAQVPARPPPLAGHDEPRS